MPTPPEVLRSLLLEDLLLVLRPDVHEAPGFVHDHGVVHEAVEVDEPHPPLLRVVHHGGDDGQLPHLFLVVLFWDGGGGGGKGTQAWGQCGTLIEELDDS